MKTIKLPWIQQGYRLFAYEGPQGLKVERIAKAVGKSKSSFYHLFADLEVFTEQLLTFHTAQAQLIADKESQAQGEQELIAIIVAHKIDLLFNRQLRIHRENADFERCFHQINQISVPAIMPVWKQIIALPDHSALAQMVWHLSIENFFLQITDESLNEAWLATYFANIRSMVYHFKQQGSQVSLDGSV